MKHNAVVFVAVLLVSLVPVSPIAAQQAPQGLTVVSAGPVGETASLQQGNEIRVVFSEPMVVLGRIPQPVTAPFLTIAPAVTGSFRWSGTTILIFTPDPRRKLPYATRYDVTIDTSATAVSGRRLAAPYTFTFTTPTVRLVAADWYRKNKRYDSPMIVALRFNQPVRAADIIAHTTLHFEKHEWKQPVLTPDAQARLKTNDPQAILRFNAKVLTAARAAAATSSVTFTAAADWDKKRFAPSSDLVVLEVSAPVPTESWVRVEIDAAVPAIEGRSLPDKLQSRRIEAERTFFVERFRCRVECDPDRWNPIELRGSIEIARIQKVLSVRDITDPKQQPMVTPAKAARRDLYDLYGRDYAISLEDAGFNQQPPSHTYVVRLDASLETSEDGQTLGYTWLDIVENWHQRAFTSFGDGHGVWESGAGLLLPFYARNFQDATEWAVPVTRDELMPRILALEPSFSVVPPGEGVHRTLRSTIDKIESHGLDLSRALAPSQKGLVWAGVREGEPIAHAKRSQQRRDNSTIVQVTNLGISVKYSPQNTLVFVTRLDNGDAPGRARKRRKELGRTPAAQGVGISWSTI